MRIIDLYERSERLEIRDVFGREHDVRLHWNPKPDQIVNLIKKSSSKYKELRVLLVGDDLLLWDGFNIQHDDMILALGLPWLQGRDHKLFVGLREDGTPWITTRAENSAGHPQIVRILDAGFKLGSARYA